MMRNVIAKPFCAGVMWMKDQFANVSISVTLHPAQKWEAHIDDEKGNTLVRHKNIGMSMPIEKFKQYWHVDCGQEVKK